jgi:hypothetical protein
MTHQVHDEGLEDVVKEVAKFYAEEFVGSTEVMDSALVSKEDGVATTVSVTRYSFAVG